MADATTEKIVEFFDHDVCAKCGGECCKHCSCLAHPDDFGSTPEQVMENLEAAMESGMWIIDYWDGECPSLPDEAAGYFVRPRMVAQYGSQTAWVYGSWGGVCLFFNEDGGCMLPDEARPLGGRTVEPAPDGKECKQHLMWEGINEKPWFALAWYPYELAIESMVARHRARNA